MDIRKLQRVIVDGLEDVKGQNIAVFNTEHLSSMFERVIIASGTSNRQTKALAASVRDAVKSGGFGVLRTEGEANGEWIIVDCGAAVVHLMQPTIREYYHLEEIWGDKPVKMKLDSAPRGLVKATDETPAAAPRKAAANKSVAKKSLAKKSVAEKSAAEKSVPKKSVDKKTVPKKAASTIAVKQVTMPTVKTATKKAGAGSVGSRSAPTKQPVSRAVPGKSVATAPARTRTLVVKTAPRKTVARKATAGVTRTVGVKRPAAAKKAGRAV